MEELPSSSIRNGPATSEVTVQLSSLDSPPIPKKRPVESEEESP